MKIATFAHRLIAARTPLICTAFVLSASTAALANGGGGGTLPWDGPLAALAGFLTGSVAKYISIIAIFVAGLALIFGEELGQFARRMLMIVIAIAFLVGASAFATTFIGSASGAVL